MRLLSDKRAQLHMVEAILSITLLSLLLVVLYLNAYPSTVQNIGISQEQAYECLATSDDAGVLRPAVYDRTASTLGALEDFIYVTLPSDVLFRVIVDSDTLPIGAYQSTSTVQIRVSYWLSGYNAVNQYNNDYLVHLELWKQTEV